MLVGGVLIIMGAAMGFTSYLIVAQVPARGAAWVTAGIHSKWAFLLILNAFLLVVGCLMDIFSAIFVVVPLILPVAAAFGSTRSISGPSSCSTSSWVISRRPSA